MPNVNVVKVKSTFRHQIGDSVFHANHTGKELGYSTHGKQVIRENPGLLRGFNKVVKENLTYYKDPEGRFSIRREKPRNKTNTNSVFIVYVGLKKYFVKESNDTNIDRNYGFDIKHKHGRDGVSEHKAIELINQDKEAEVIPAHISYVDPIKRVSFITCEFSQLKTIDDLYRENKITAIRYKNLSEKIDKLEKRINSQFHKYGLDRYYSFYDLGTDNAFYSLKERKFYIFDPILLKK